MEKPSSRFLTLITVLLLGTLVMLILAIVGFAASAPAVGITFGVLMVACAAGAFAVTQVFRRRVRQWRDEQIRQAAPRP